MFLAKLKSALENLCERVKIDINQDFLDQKFLLEL